MMDWCPLTVPWEKLSRKTSVPASTNLRSISTDSVAGPTVQMIFVRRMLGNPIDLGRPWLGLDISPHPGGVVDGIFGLTAGRIVSRNSVQKRCE
jgi:hypothetical protein